MNATVNRRNFLRTGAAAAGGLLIGCYLPERRRLAAETATAPNKLNAWVQKPSALVPGVKMNLPPVEDPKERADLIAFLDTLT